jgi:hypothetical protein
MSERYPGALITKTPVTPAGPYQTSAAPGVWTLDQQMQYQKQGVWPTAGLSPNYIEDVFSTYLYTGTGASQTITNGIDLSGKGGLVWMKSRSAATDHALYDTARGATFDLVSNTTAAQTTQATGLTAFGTTGFSIGALAKINTSAATYVSWSFREQPKFFDIVTYTGTGANRTIAHNLGSTPGCIIVKRTDTTSDWQVYHNGLTSAAYSIQLNLTNGQASAPTIWNSTSPTSSVFSVGTSTTVNASGGTYVAYLFAHNAGGFGNAGTDNVISCGIVTAGFTNVTLGWEPQFVLIKSITTAYDWEIYDTFRGLTTIGEISKQLVPNSNSAEASMAGACNITATGMQIQDLIPSTDRIYIAIRRGPMKTPTSGTSVFSPIAVNAATGTIQTTNFVIDSQWKAKRATDTLNTSVDDRLRGLSTTATASGRYLITSSTAAEDTTNATTQAWNNTGFQIPTYYGSASDIFYSFGRAPGFFDEVCYTGTGSNTTQAHNLGVVPELMIVKGRSGATAWQVYSSALANTEYLVLNTTAAKATGATRWNSTTPTSTVFSLGTATEVNTSAATYVAYLFATVAGVSKVGSYSGTGATQTVNCGFTGGARFVLIKRTDSTGDWYVWDTARGMVAGTDPSIRLNTTAAEVNANSVYTTGVGFQIVSTAAGINASGGSYIFLAVA